MKPTVEAGLIELRVGLQDNNIRHLEDGEGGAFVIVDELFIGENFTPSTAWIGFHITWSYPDADVYPHFLGPQVKYVGAREAPNQHPDGNLPVPMTRGATMPGFNQPAIQISRRSQRRSVETDSALLKLMRVLAFLTSK
jgi:hypothetical protein